MTVVVITLTVTITLVYECQGFAPTMMPRTIFNFGFPQSFEGSVRSSSLSLGQNENFLRWRRRTHHHWTTRQMAVMSDEAAFLSNDPFVILGLENPTADKKVLKRAYKKRALKFHPDIVTDLHSSREEKKKASDRFAKINGAYEQLMGKGKGNGSSNGSNDEAASSSGGWTPPHRRTNSYTSSSSSSRSSEGASTDWRDYMPDYQKDNDADYDTGGDSFGQIFSDLFTGAAGAAVSSGIGGVGGGIFNEFLEFLEGGAAGVGGSEDDADLRVLLQTATMEEVAEEMDDTEMVVKQLETKSRGLDDEIFAMDAEAKMASRFSEKIELEERAASLKARKDVLSGYLSRARKRLLALQTRYKELISSGGNDDYAAPGGRSRSSWKDESTTERPSSSSSSYSRGSSSYGSTSRTETSGTRGAEGRTNDNNDKSDGDGDGDSWRNEGFGSSSGRSRRGSGRRRTTSRSRSSASSSAGVDPNPARPSPSPSPSYSTTEASRNNNNNNDSNNNASRSRQPPPPTTTPSPSPSTSESSAVSKSNYSYDVPPHRRTSGSTSFASRQEEDRKRMQEIKVDDEFEKLKKELGL